MKQVESLKNTFVQTFGGGASGIRVFHAPGRINLIGEHTDYNGGYVFPAALTFGTYMLLRPRKDAPGKVRFASTNFPLQKEIELQSMANVKEDDWINYPKAVLHHLMKKGYTFGDYDVLFHGNIPNGAGLSSSASIQLATAFGFMTAEGHPIDRTELALTAQESENQFIGVNCGIMDQFTIANGKKAHAVLLKCNTLDFEHVPFQSAGHKVVIGNTNKRRGLVDSEYNARRLQCEQAVKDLQKHYPGITLLGELNAAQLAEHGDAIQDPIVRKRAAHVIEENDRVMASVTALKQGDLQEFGRLMSESHRSLRDLYEVSCRELDVMVDAAMQADGVLGSRMTGAGFGGCTVSLVQEDRVEAFIDKVGEAYARQTDYEADFYVADIGDGVHEVQ